MAVTLWIVMLAFAAAGWYVSHPGGRRAPRIAIAVAEAAFVVWVILTQLSTVGYWWLVVTVALGLVVSFRSDLERIRTGRTTRNKPNQTGPDPTT